MILLDTNVCIAYLHGDPQIADRLFAADEQDSVLIPGIVVGELYYGVERSQRRAENLEMTERFLALFPVCFANETVMKLFGLLKAFAAKAGRRVEDADVIIAATAIANDATLITGNVKHFSRFLEHGLKIENWHKV